MGFKSHIWKKKKKKNRVSSGFAQVTWVPGRPAGSPGFGRAVSTAGLLLNPDRSSHRVYPPGRAGFNNSGAKVINYLRTVLNALKFLKQNEETEKAYLAAGCFAGVLVSWAKIGDGVRW